MLPNNDPEVGSPPQEPGQEPAGQEQTPPAPVTQDVLDESLKQFRNGIQEMLNKNYQGIQSQTDRYQSQVTEQVSGFEAQLRSLQSKGIVNMTEPQIQQAVRENRIDELLDQQNGQPQAQAPGQVQQPGQTQVPQSYADQINAAAEAIETEHKVTLDAGDPEITQFEIDKHAQSSNPLDYLRAIENAVKAKAERVSKQSPARAPGLIQGTPGQSNPLENVTDLGQLWSQTSLGKRNS
jgi:hypothetical protein